MRKRLPPLLLATGAILCSAGFITSATIRDESPVYQDLGNVAFVWQAMLLIGGCGTVWGVRRDSPKAEASGLALVSGGMLMYVVGAFAHGGLASWTAGILITASALSILARVWNVTHGRLWS